MAGGSGWETEWCFPVFATFFTFLAICGAFLDSLNHDWYAPHKFCMPVDYNPYLLITVFMVAAAGFGLMPLVLAWLWAKAFSPQKPGPDKNATYECGLESKGDAWIQFKSEYYLYGIIFLIFDVEAIFLFPFAVAFTGLPVGGFVGLMGFILLLVEGLVLAWPKRVPPWESSSPTG